MTREQSERRQLRAMRYKAQGKSTSEIARLLKITHRRVQQWQRQWADGRIPVCA